MPRCVALPWDGLVVIWAAAPAVIVLCGTCTGFCFVFCTYIFFYFCHWFYIF